MESLILWDGRSICGLKKIPKTILIVDEYNTITPEKKSKIKDSVAEMDIDFEEEATRYSLVILCNTVLRFNLKNPLVLAECEIWFTRKTFSSKVFEDALIHYSECEIRNGV
ncbi:uncharacterized protein Eint_101490 [Encephalitozoon intestinalis ATCC 50506]|uniref:Uncharacterized protein n=1 Tax=Encephalitozoon intestinalis (strain ATCC 50506) TaxID=876142 RepID=E0S9T9_ENCIT|nr:uncharacterized protein Eint_101490 [Encephalitozoon intestinalis ATCC 50506]ADM12474.1 hypothetical protein Eint_101490 [Encephalitozoon intestinalis ATCC 50506]UTX46311.1 DUF5099 domain-containing protein [Encephalitozoon intestinalis]